MSTDTRLVIPQFDLKVGLPSYLVNDEKPSGLFLNEPHEVPAGKMIIDFKHAGHQVPHSTWASIQTSPVKHEEGLGLVATINHSCDPSVFVDVQERCVVTLEALSPGQELTYFYPSTEYVSSKPLVCRCGAERCIGIYAGAKYLTVAKLAEYRLNLHVIDMVAASLLAKAVNR